MQLADLLARWNTDTGKPYKGTLIDTVAYRKDPDNPGCMCAQGQVLHELGGWDVDKLTSVEQHEADKAVAALLNISLAHSLLLRQINDSQDGAPAIVLTDPGKVIGDQWSKILDFWWALDQMTPAARAAWVAARAAWAAARQAAWAAARQAAWGGAWEAARQASGDAAQDVAWDAAGDAARDVAWDAAGATNEIQGAEVMRAKGQAFFFLPLFGFATPGDIPSRPADYGAAPHTTNACGQGG